MDNPRKLRGGPSGAERKYKMGSFGHTAIKCMFALAVSVVQPNSGNLVVTCSTQCC